MNNKTIKKIQFGGWNKQNYREIRGVIKRMTKERAIKEQQEEMNKVDDFFYYIYKRNEEWFVDKTYKNWRVMYTIIDDKIL